MAGAEILHTVCSFYTIWYEWPSLTGGYPMVHFSWITCRADSALILSIWKKEIGNGKIKAVFKLLKIRSAVKIPPRAVPDLWLLIIQLLLRQSVYSARWVALLVSGGSPPSFLSSLGERRLPTGPPGPPCSGDQSHQSDICLCLRGESLCQGD